MGHAIEPSTTVAYAHRYHLRQKKDVVYGLLFSLHASADLRVTNPIRNPFFPNASSQFYTEIKSSYQTQINMRDSSSLYIIIIILIS